jgi:ketoreductase RED1
MSPVSRSVHLTDDLELAVRDADVVQENGPESLKFKQELFASLVGLTPRAHVAAFLVFGDSGHSVHRRTGRRGPGADRPSVQPAAHRSLVEVVPGARTEEQFVGRAVAFYRAMGRVPVVERKEIPGFVGNRLQSALSREAIYLVE